MMFSVDNPIRSSSSSSSNHLISGSCCNNGSSGSNSGVINKISLRKNSGQNIPLLDSNGIIDSDLDDDDDAQNDDNQNANEVIFDILKRRDATRR